MFQRRIPEDLRHAPHPGVRGFAALAAVEACARGILTSVFPVMMYHSLGTAEAVSEAYLAIGVVSMFAALLTPWLSRFVARRYLYSGAVLTMMIGNLIAMNGGALAVTFGLTLNTIATVALCVCFNAYVMDYVERNSLGHPTAARSKHTCPVPTPSSPDSTAI